MDDAKLLLGGFTELARALASALDEDTRLKVAVDAAVDLVPRCDHAGITINEHGRLVTRASSDDLVCRATSCRPSWAKDRASMSAGTLVSPALAMERRWPVWAPRVQQIDQLGLALHNRTIIGQAQGVLMERYGMGADQAFDYLRRISSHSNRRVVAVAAEIAETRRIPDGG